MSDLEKAIQGIEICVQPCSDCNACPYNKSDDLKCVDNLRRDVVVLLKAQEPRVMDVDEVIACEKGTVLWVEERQGVVWNLFPLEIEVNSIHPDTGTAYLFFVTYHDCRKFECSEYNYTWRCWTSRPTDEQREATSWI